WGFAVVRVASSVRNLAAEDHRVQYPNPVDIRQLESPSGIMRRSFASSVGRVEVIVGRVRHTGDGAGSGRVTTARRGSAARGVEALHDANIAEFAAAARGKLLEQQPGNRIGDRRVGLCEHARGDAAAVAGGPTRPGAVHPDGGEGLVVEKRVGGF